MKVYEVKIGGIVHTVQLTDEDAEAQGLKPVAEKKASPEPANKARKAPNKAGE